MEETNGTLEKEDQDQEIKRKKKTVSLSEPDPNIEEVGISPEPIPLTKFQKFQQKYLKHAPQVGAISGALLLIIYSGQLFGWAIFNKQMKTLDYENIFPNDIRKVRFFVHIWFWGAILGSFMCVGMALVERTRTIYSICLGVTLAAVFYLLVLPVVHEVIAINRAIAAIAYGIAYSHLIKHAANIAVPKYRGFIVSLIHLSLILGALINSINFCIKVQPDKQPFGTEKFGIFYTVFGLLFAALFTTESPLRLIQKNNENKALENMADLRTALVEEDDEVIADFEDLKLMIQEDANERWWRFYSQSNIFPMVLTMSLKFVFFLSFNYIINETLASDFHFENETYDYSSLTLLLVRLLAIITTLGTIDLNRRWHLVAPLLLGAVCLVLAGLTFLPVNESRATVYTFCIIFQILAGIGTGALADIFMAEAFSVTKRPLSISIVVSFELLLQYLVYQLCFNVVITSYSKAVIYGTTGTLLILFGGFLLLVTPETSKLSLRQTRDACRHLYMWLK